MKLSGYSNAILIVVVATLLLPFTSAGQFQCQWDLFCVTNVHYDTMPGKLYVEIYNGNSQSVNMINYPTVQVVSPNGDTIGNPNGTFEYFGHTGETTQAYSIAITDTAITNFSTYTFLLTDAIWDTTGIIQKCFVSSIAQVANEKVAIYPTITSSILYCNTTPGIPLAIYTQQGQLVKQVLATPQILVNDLPAGIYIVVTEKNSQRIGRFIKP